MRSEQAWGVQKFGKHIILSNSRLTILPSLLIAKSGRPYIRVVGRSFVRHGRDSSDVTLAFEDAQVIKTVMDDEWWMMDDGM